MGRYLVLQVANLHDNQGTVKVYNNDPEMQLYSLVFPIQISVT